MSCAHSWGALCLSASVGLGTLACSGDDGDRATQGGAGGDSHVFGGAAGATAGSSTAGAGSGAGSTGGSGASGGRCAAAPPVSEFRIDNFEDGNTSPVSEPHRHGTWAVSMSDDQPNATFVVDEGGADGTDFAAHVTSDVFTQNALSLGLGSDVDGQGCPYNASGTRGVGLWVRGAGRLMLRVTIDDVFSLEWGGTCDEEVSMCWDTHQKLIPLSSDYTYHEVRWADLSQAGWGDAFPFDPSGIMNLLFTSALEGEPADFWVDELRFLPETLDSGANGE